MPATELATAIKARKVSPVEAMEAALVQADATQAMCNAFITLDGDQAMETAKAQEAALMQGDASGAWFGVPVSVKDLCNTKDRRTTCGSL